MAKTKSATVTPLSDRSAASRKALTIRSHVDVPHRDPRVRRFRPEGEAVRGMGGKALGRAGHRHLAGPHHTTGGSLIRIGAPREECGSQTDSRTS